MRVGVACESVKGGRSVGLAPGPVDSSRRSHCLIVIVMQEKCVQMISRKVVGTLK